MEDVETTVAPGSCPLSGFRITRQGRRLVGTAILLMVELILSVPVFGQFGSSQLKSFCSSSELGMEPRSAPIQGSDGSLYGTTLLGGGTLMGTIFKLNPDGSGYRVIHRFTSTEPADGSSPYGGLLEGSDHLLYGTTYDGGITNQGTVYRLNKDGSDFAVLHRFAGGAGCGTLFRIAPAASFSINPSGDTSVTGPPGYRFTVQYLNFLESPGQWQNLTSITLSNSPSHITDPSAGSTQQRFYRAVLNP